MKDELFQEVSNIVLEELLLNPVKFVDNNHGFYTHFFKLKQKDPEKYKELIFENGEERHYAYSNDLKDIFDGFKLAGFIDCRTNNFTYEGKMSAVRYLAKHNIDVLQ